MTEIPSKVVELVSETATVIRARIAHSYTLKDGWRLSETTVEATGTTIDYEQIRDQLRRAYAEGREESIRRNNLERGEHNRGVPPISTVSVENR